MTIEEYKKKSKNKKSFFSKALNKILLLTIIVFSFMILVNFKPELKDKIKNKITKTNFNFSYLSKIYNNYFLDIFDSKEKTKTVMKEVIKKDEDYKEGKKIYLNNTNNINLLYSGIVVYIGKKDDYGNTIIVQQSNGIDAWYGNVEKSNVKLYDYVEKGKQIGTTNNYYYLVYEKDKKKITYEEANKKN